MVSARRTPQSSLVVGERVVSWSDGLFEAEYALFDAEDVIVTAQLGFGAREQGYLTTAGLARARMRALGITGVLAGETFAAFRAAHLRTLARASFVADALEHLGALEAFEGGRFEPGAHTYEGTWLDLRALAQACPLSSAGLVLQALHLLLVVEEVPEDVPVRMLTAEATASRKAGTRTWAKVRFEAARRLPWVLRSMRVAPARPPLLAADDEERLRDSLAASLRDRATAAPAGRVRLQSLEAKIARARGAIPPSADSLETGTAALRLTPQPRTKVPRTASPPKGDDPSLFDELRRHTDLLRGDAHLRDVAQFLSAMAERKQSVPELANLAARAWLAAGEIGHARHLAKELVANLDTREGVRLVALEILKSTSPTNESILPPPVATIEPTPIVMLESQPDRAAPAGSSLPPFANEPPNVTATRAPLPPAAPASPSSAGSIPAVVVTPVPPASRDAEVAAGLFVRAAGGASTPGRLGRSEIVESLPLPEGLAEEQLDEGRAPATPGQMRIAMTRQARTLGRDYRLWYGTTLKTNALAIEAMQRHLRRRFADGADAKALQVTDAKLERELTRHGALLSEILARILGAEWVDVSGDEPGRWAMVLTPSLRVWPIGRVYRFFRQGHREADLVAFYLDLERALLGGAK